MAYGTTWRIRMASSPCFGSDDPCGWLWIWFGIELLPSKRTLLVRVGIATFAIGLMLFMAASTALGIYGKLADRNAVMIVDVEPLRSIPTEVEAQAEKAYPLGSIARLEKSF